MFLLNSLPRVSVPAAKRPVLSIPNLSEEKDDDDNDNYDDNDDNDEYDDNDESLMNDDGDDE